MVSNRIVIASVARTPIAKFCGSLAPLKASELGSLAIRGAMDKLCTTDKDNESQRLPIMIREAFVGNVVSAGMGQAPARQAVLGAGLPETTICTTINKVCASGMKAVMLASQACRPGSAMLAGGMESMSNIPHYLPSARTGGIPKLGNVGLIDGLVRDGLWDVYNDQHMGVCAERCAEDYGISRTDQDAYAVESYERARTSLSFLAKEIVPVETSFRRRRKKTKDDPPMVFLDQDEEISEKNYPDLEKLTRLPPAFVVDDDDKERRGTVTAGNASSLNDGACAMVLMTEKDALDHGIKPLARILGFGDAEQDPVKFTTSPSKAVPVALSNAGGMQITDIDYHEINEAFAVVALANMELLNLDPTKVNVFGGAVALGHPIGMSGARIIATLLNVLQHKDATVGCASICNGGGGASAIVLERMN